LRFPVPLFLVVSWFGPSQVKGSRPCYYALG
jgi:hypothetical protein